MFRIVSKLRLCGEDVTDGQMLEKIFSTFHASNLVLQQQYRERGFKTYSKLILCMHVAEENNQLLLNNHNARPTGSKPLPEISTALPEANATSSQKRRGHYHGSPRGHSYGRGRGRGNGRGNIWINPIIQKHNGNKAKNQQEKTTNEDLCYRYNTHIDALDFFQSIKNEDKNLPELPLQFGDIIEDFDMLVD
ncbi:UNVERIFIED_CONTAM: hypothetical protein Sindi_0050900 [Sesamum indicum]